MKSSIVLGRRACLLAVTALAVACGSSGGTGTSTGTGGVGTGNGTGGSTTGPSCAFIGQSCSHLNCCSPNTCQNTFCASPSATGSGSGGTSTSGSGVDPCPVGAAGATCKTSVECEPGLLCVDAACATPPSETPSCTLAGNGPTSTAPCCESTEDAGPSGLTCVAWNTCLTQGENCSDGGTCCNTLTCGSDGTCDPACAGVVSPCKTDADCCAGEGTQCVKGSMFNNNPPIPGSICYPIGLPIEQPWTINQHNYCWDEPQCVAFDAGIKGVVDCQLGSNCDVGIPEDGGTDPCAQDGLVCDSQYAPDSVCRNPNLFEQCIPGGPPCNQQADSTSPIVCSDMIFGQLGTISLCTYECTSTADCVEPWLSCFSNGEDDCVFAEQSTGCAMNTPTDLLGTCNAASINDGICLAIGGENPSNTSGLCTQAVTDGDGGPGAACNDNGNRQLGGLCDTSDLCAGNICGKLCNAGTLKVPACGAGQSCLPVLDVYGINVGPDPTVDSYTTGACVTPCDFTLEDAGPCGATSEGVPTKCVPAESLGYAPKAVLDFCMAGPSAKQAIPIGGDCSGAIFGNAVDPCVDGAECLGNALFGETSICRQLCKDANINKTGAPGCPTGYTCTALNFTGTDSTHTGFCMPPATADGG